MPRASRYLEEGFVYHLTHRCVDGDFFLRSAHERDAYRRWLREGALRYHVPVLGYCVTRNHVHVVVEADDRRAVASMMQLAAGAVAQSFNTRKGRDGSVWEHPYHCTRIQDGQHLLNCLRYVDLNMVRAGTVRHPRAWRWCAYDEFTGRRQRYRIVDRSRLLALTTFPDLPAFAERHKAAIEELLAKGVRREPCWTECVAVGDEAFIDSTEQSNTYRRNLERRRIDTSASSSTWTLREARPPYSTVSDPNSAL